VLEEQGGSNTFLEPKDLTCFFVKTKTKTAARKTLLLLGNSVMEKQRVLPYVKFWMRRGRQCRCLFARRNGKAQLSRHGEEA
jgi:hypothetical protein